MNDKDKIFELSLENSRYFHLLGDATLKIEKLQAENAKLREFVEEVSVMANDERWYDIEHALKELEEK